MKIHRLFGGAQEHPQRKARDERPAPPVAHQGQRDALRRRYGRADGDVHRGLEPQPEGDSRRAERAVAVARERDARSVVDYRGEEGDDKERAAQPQLLSDDGHDKVRVGLGDVVELEPPRAEARAEHSPFPNAIRDCRA